MPSSARWLGPLLACAAAACSGQTGPPMRIRLAHAATSDARCFVPMGPQPEDQPLASVTLDDLTIQTVRITVREHAVGDVAGNFLCDRILRVPKDVPSLELPRGTAAVGRHLRRGLGAARRPATASRAASPSVRCSMCR